MKNSILSFFLLCSCFFVHAQEGFIQVYDLGYGIIGFQNILLENDTLICVGGAHDPVTTRTGIHFAKIDTTGQVLFERLYLHPDEEVDFIAVQPNASIITTSDHGYVMYGQNIDNDLYFLKLNHEGEVVFFKTYHFSAFVLWPRQIIEVQDGFLISGSRQKAVINSMTYDMFIKKVDLDGEEIWEKYYGDPLIDKNRLERFVQLDDNTFVLGYGSGYWHTDDERWRFSNLTAIDSTGEIKWEWSSMPEDEIYNTWGLTPTEDGGWVFAARHLEDSPYGGNSYFMVL